MSSDATPSHTGPLQSRRAFLRTSAVGLGAAAGPTSLVFAADMGESEIPSIRLPEDLTASLAEDPSPGTFEGRGQSGATVTRRLAFLARYMGWLEQQRKYGGSVGRADQGRIAVHRHADNIHRFLPMVVEHLAENGLNRVDFVGCG